jgi:ParB family chromosome partitioning protein
MEMCIQEIPLGEIDIPDGQRELGNLEPLMASIQEIGLMHPIPVTRRGARYRMIAGWRRYNAYKRLGKSQIPAIVLEMDDLHVALATIDENLIRQNLTALEHAEQIVRRKEIYETLHSETKRGNGPGRGHREKKRNKFASFAADTASKTGRDKRTIQQAVQIATNLSDGVKEKIRSLPIADKKNDLLHLARMPQETQEAIVGHLVSGAAKSVREVQRVLNADAGAPDSKPATRRSPQGKTLDPRLTEVEPDGEDGDTLLHTVVAYIRQSSAITESQIAGRPATEVMAERLAALPWPELVLLRGLLVGQVQEAAASWVAAVRADVKDEDHHFESVMSSDSAGDPTNDADVPLTSTDDQAEESASSDCTAHASRGDNARSEEQRRSTTVMAERGDDGADAEVRADGDQLHLSWGSEEQPPHGQVPSLREEEKRSEQASATTSADVADPLEPSSPEVQAAENAAALAIQNDRCGWCGSRDVSPLDSTQGRIHCKACHAVYKPRKGCWDPGEAA